MRSPSVLVDIPFEEAHPEALSLYCSDGRFTRSVEALLHKLGHPRLDTLTMPGGPGLLDADGARLSESSSVRRATSFLVQGHGIKTVILIAHEGCGYYRKRYRGRSPEELISIQIAELQKAASWLESAHPALRIECYYARPHKGRIAFSSVDSTLRWATAVDAPGDAIALAKLRVKAAAID
jgi:hypothetical protein